MANQYGALSVATCFRPVSIDGRPLRDDNTAFDFHVRMPVPTVGETAERIIPVDYNVRMRYVTYEHPVCCLASETRYARLQ